ncbi:MAG: DUF4139 domain-containing protein [Thermoanaerobaculia bacterium]
MLRAISRALFVLGLGTTGLARPAVPAEIETGETIRQELVLTNQNLALVSETRRSNLPAGEVLLSRSGVASSARTETWSLTNAREAKVRWRGLTSALPSESRSWLTGLEGKRIRIERPAGGGSTEAEVVAVFGDDPEHVLLREGADLVYGEPGARLVLPGGTPGAARLGRVRLKLESEWAGPREITSRYLVGEINWEADYALTLAPDERSGRLEGWFQIENRSGAEFAPTRLRLLAGVLRASTGPRTPATALRYAAAEVAVEPSVPVSESRMYELASPGSLAQGRTTFPLAASVEVPVEKRYLVRTTYGLGENAESQSLPVEVVYHVGAKTIEAALPAGTVRIYAGADSVFTGEDRIAHTPEKTDFEIETSEAFDLTARRRQSSFQQLSPRKTESGFETTITSRKKEAATVIVRENFPGDWTLIQSSIPGSRRSARVVEFAVPVPAGGQAELTYRVRVRTGR